jgi:hypothetical protein
LPEEYQNFHLQFLLKLLEKLGHLPEGFSVLDIASVNQFDNYLEAMYRNSYRQSIKITHIERTHILEGILKYYRKEFDALHNLKSLTVLKEVLS